MLFTAGPIQEEIGSDVIYSQARSRRTRTNGPTRSFTFQDLPGVPVWCREAWTRTWNYTGLGRNPYGTKCVGRIVTKSMSYFLHLCDCSLPYCATLEAWNWFVAGQHLNASHPRSPVWPNQNVTLFSGNYFWKNLKRSLLLNR